MPIGLHVRTRKHTRIAMHIPGTHARIARCTPGPLERALVTPHKSIQSLRSRRTERPSGRRGLWRSGPRQPFASAQQLLFGRDMKPPRAPLLPSQSSKFYITTDRYRRRRPPDPGPSRICVSPRLQTPRPTAGRNRRLHGRGRS